MLDKFFRTATSQHLCNKIGAVSPPQEVIVPSIIPINQKRLYFADIKVENKLNFWYDPTNSKNVK